jgi:hypothetical protein
MSPGHEYQGELGIGDQGRFFLLGIDSLEFIQQLRDEKVYLAVFGLEVAQILFRIAPAYPDALRMIEDLLKDLLSEV